MKTLIPRGFFTSVILFGSVTINAMAASITLDARSITDAVNNADYRISWAAQTSAINSQILSEVTGNYDLNNKFAYLKIDFSTAENNWWFQLAPDATYGAAMYLDGQLIAKDTSDLWWDGKWNKKNEILSSFTSTLLAGSHVLEAYWAENCCSGGIGGRFSNDGGQSWKTLSVSNLNSVAIPAPDMIWLMGLGLMALVYVKSKKGNHIRLLKITT